MIPAFQFEGWEWIAFALATPVVLWAGRDFHRNAVRNARHLTATMDTLVSLGTLAAWGWSVVALFLADAHTYFEVAAVITTLILLGRYLEARARRRSGAAIRALLELGAKEARVRAEDGTEVSIPIAELEPGAVMVVRPGEKIPTDGVVLEGASAIDQSMLTGEPAPVDVAPGAEVAAARSTRSASSSCARRRLERRPPSRRSRGSSRRRRRARRRSNGSSTASRRSSSRW